MSKGEKSQDSSSVVSVTRSVVESYIFATGHQDLSIYSERLLMLLVRAAQCQVAGLNFREGTSIAQVSIGPLGDATVEIEARELLGSSGHTNYTQAKLAVLELMKKHVSHERPLYKGGKQVYDGDGKPVYEFEAHNLLNDVYINRKPGVIVVNVNRVTWEAILDFSKGFRRYDLQVAMRFRKTCSLRMFKLISNQKNALEYKVNQLREMWGLKDKYLNTKDFIRYTIDAAKEELDEISPWTFDYQKVYSFPEGVRRGKSGRKSVTSIIFFPKHRSRFESTSGVAGMLSDPVSILGKGFIDLLVKKIGFSMQEIRSNIVLFNLARKEFDVEGFLTELYPRISRAVNPQGYVVNALKGHLRDECGILFRKNGTVVKDVAEDVDPAAEKARRVFEEETVGGILSRKTVSAFETAARSDEKDLSKVLGGLFDNVDEQ